MCQDGQIFSSREVQKADARPGGYIATGGHGGILGRIGDQSMDAEAGTLNSMFDFSSKKGRASNVFLDPDTGEVVSKPAKPAKH